MRLTKEEIEKIRNIGISAHIDSGKTTLTERILYYTGRIREIHEVKGKDGVGAKMDSMDLEREKGITIQSAATYVQWKDTHINIIDTPGHVDFTIEVERALRVLDGAILVICAVGGVQSQTYTVHRQMSRYSVPRLVFINKMDRAGAGPDKIVAQLRQKLGQNCCLVQVPIGAEEKHEGVVDIIERKAYLFEGIGGTEIKEITVPESLKAEVETRRAELIDNLCNCDEKFGELVVFEEVSDPPVEEIKAAIRRATISLKFSPVFVGSAFKNKGVQKLLDGVIDYLPSPLDRDYSVTNLDSENKELVPIKADPNLPLVGLAFKLEEGRFGQLTYLRVYQGKLVKGATIMNVSNGKKIKVPRIVRMHSNEMKDVDGVGCGEICALFGVDCFSGTTFSEGENVAMMSMHIPKPVISLSIKNLDKKKDSSFTKALQRFQKEDPTFVVTYDQEAQETIISGMGELHLFIYTERLKREYDVTVVTGQPKVAYRETITSMGKFDYTHKKQSGGQGQFAKIVGSVEPYGDNYPPDNEFVDDTIGNSIPPEYMSACRKGFLEAVSQGPIAGFPVTGVRMSVQDGASHSVDSSDLAFRICTIMAFKQGVRNSDYVILEPVMEVAITVPIEYQGNTLAGIGKRRGLVKNTEQDKEFAVIYCEVPLSNMFGYSTDLRSQTQGKGEFTMEYLKHTPVQKEVQAKLIAAYEAEKKKGNISVN